MEAVLFSETSVNVYQTTRPHIPEDTIPHKKDKVFTVLNLLSTAMNTYGGVEV
jgi:hypothetical protein